MRALEILEQVPLPVPFEGAFAPPVSIFREEHVSLVEPPPLVLVFAIVTKLKITNPRIRALLINNLIKV